MNAFLAPVKIADQEDMSVNFESAVQEIKYLTNVCVQATWTGDATGVLAVQASGDWDPHFETGDWVTIVTANITEAGSVLFDLDALSFPYLRVIYTADTGDGNLDAIVTGKSA